MKIFGWLCATAGFLVVVGLLFVIGVRNGLVKSDEGCGEKAANVQTMLQRRMDLIPNLVNAVKGSMAHEKDVLESVTQARASATQVRLTLQEAMNDPEKMKQLEQLQGQLGASLGRLLMSVEKYPDLKANAQVADLMVELSGTENRISTERVRYNEAVRSYNGDVRGWPGSWFAGDLGLVTRQRFEAPASAQNVPVVEFK